MSVLLQLNFVDSSVGLLFELVASRGDPSALLLPGVVGAVARLREALVDGDPAACGPRRSPSRPALAPFHAFVATLVCSRSR